MCAKLTTDKRSGCKHWRRNHFNVEFIAYRLSALVAILLINIVATQESAFSNSTDRSETATCKINSRTTYYAKMDETGDTSPDVELVEDGFGLVEVPDKDGVPCSTLVRRFTMTNKKGMVVQIITYGATVTSLKFPDKQGHIEDVVLGYDDISGYLSHNNPYFGAVVGRVANRIRGGKFSIGQQEYQVSKNRGHFTLHGGFKGFDKVIWESHVEGTKLTLSYLSKDGEEGFPGTLLAHATYQLTPDNELILEMKATSTKPTPVNLVNHSYFNLAGHASGERGLFQHLVSINADKYVATDGMSIPTGEIKEVGGTHLDLRIPKKLQNALPAIPVGGFDNNLCINRHTPGELAFVARVEHPRSGRVLEVHSDQPGVQFYTSNFLPENNATDGNEVIGKGRAHYNKWGAFCLETQNYPDAVNNKNFPDSILTPGSEYLHRVVYSFSIMESIDE